MESGSLATEQILEIRNELETMTEDQDLIERLNSLEQATITIDQLKETKIAKVINKLSKQNKALTMPCKLIIKKWKQLLRDQIKEKARKKKPQPQVGNERERIRAMFCKALEGCQDGDAELREQICMDLETALYSSMNEAKYKAKARGIHANLKDPKNGHLRDSLLDGSILPQDLAEMSYEEMANPDTRRIREEAAKQMMEARRTDWLDANIQTKGDSIIACRKCKANKVDYFQMQTRSADEPMTVFYNCKACGFRWKE